MFVQNKSEKELVESAIVYAIWPVSLLVACFYVASLWLLLAIENVEKHIRVLRKKLHNVRERRLQLLMEKESKSP